jgi:xanthine/CO dehydrogenase XdhC/CoxF family maturation factor
VERYSTADDDGDKPYGSGCGGVVYILLERRITAAPLMTALEAAFHARAPLSIATVLEGFDVPMRVLAGPTIQPKPRTETPHGSESMLNDLAHLALERMQSIDQRVTVDGAEIRVWVDYRPARPGLWVFGAGDDARPLLAQARALGWFVAVADGRSHLVTKERFPDAHALFTLPIAELPAGSSSVLQDLKPTDAVVLVTHSFEQDSRILASLLGRDSLPAYVGVLGPQRRTREVLAEAGRLLGLPADAERVENWLAQLHAPTGLDIGAETPAAIALSIMAEIQQTLNNGSALPLRQVRAVHGELSKACTRDA